MKEVYGKNTDPDWARIAHLFKIGIIASLLALIGGDMIRYEVVHLKDVAQMLSSV